MRSNRVEVRNPLLALPSMARLQALPSDQRQAIAEIFHEMAIDAGDRAEQSWLKKKGPMAAYWKAVSVYAKHARAAVRKGRP